MKSRRGVLVLFVLLGVFAWLVWPEKEKPEPIAVGSACSLQANEWCWTTDVRPQHVYTARCHEAYYAQCIAGRDPSRDTITREQHDQTMAAIRIVQRGWTCPLVGELGWSCPMR
jgi:hypothetical protein